MYKQLILIKWKLSGVEQVPVKHVFFSELEQEYERAKLFNILAWSQIVKFHNIHRDGTDNIVGGKSMTNMFLY